MKTWNLRGLSGLRADIIAKVTAAPDVPEADRMWIIALISGIPASVSAITLDAYCTVEKNELLFDLHIKPLF